MLHPVDNDDPMAQVEKPADTWERYKKHGSPKHFAP